VGSLGVLECRLRCEAPTFASMVFALLQLAVERRCAPALARAIPGDAPTSAVFTRARGGWRRPASCWCHPRLGPRMSGHSSRPTATRNSQPWKTCLRFRAAVWRVQLALAAKTCVFLARCWHAAVEARATSRF